MVQRTISPHTLTPSHPHPLTHSLDSESEVVMVQRTISPHTLTPSHPHTLTHSLDSESEVVMVQREAEVETLGLASVSSSMLNRNSPELCEGGRGEGRGGGGEAK